jgi:hypothetical protein
MTCFVADEPAENSRKPKPLQVSPVSRPIALSKAGRGSVSRYGLALTGLPTSTEHRPAHPKTEVTESRNRATSSGAS